MHFQVIQGDIAEQSAHVLINTTNPNMTMECGVAAALRREANGPLKTEAIQASNATSTDVIVTNAYDLDAQYVIHAIPFQNGRVTAQSITTATNAVLSRTDEMGCRSLVLPALGCGGGEYDFAGGARRICKAIAAYDPSALADVRFIAHTEDDFEEVLEAARAVKRFEPALK